MKKSILAIMLIAALLACVLPGCKNAEPDETTESIVVEDDDIAGSILINAGAVVEIMYDKTGKVLQIEGIGEKGVAITPYLQQYLLSPSTEAVYNVIAACIEKGHLPKDAFTVLVKYVKDSVIPDDNFIKGIADNAQTAADLIPITQVQKEDLDDSGYIGADKVKELLELYLASSIVPSFQGKLTPTNGVYYLCASIDEALSYYTVDAVTGDIASCTQQDYENDYYSIYVEEEEEFTQAETYIEETITE